MATPRHATDKARACDIVGCKNDAERAVSGKKLEKAGMDTDVDPAKSAHICKEHYREFKKKTKKDRVLERLDW